MALRSPLTNWRNVRVKGVKQGQCYLEITLYKASLSQISKINFTVCNERIEKTTKSCNEERSTGQMH